MCRSHNIQIGELLEQCCQTEKNMNGGILRQMPTVIASYSEKHAVVTIKFADLAVTTEFSFWGARPCLNSTSEIRLGPPS